MVHSPGGGGVHVADGDVDGVLESCVGDSAFPSGADEQAAAVRAIARVLAAVRIETRGTVMVPTITSTLAI